MFVSPVPSCLAPVLDCDISVAYTSDGIDLPDESNFDSSSSAFDFHDDEDDDEERDPDFKPMMVDGEDEDVWEEDGENEVDGRSKKGSVSQVCGSSSLSLFLVCPLHKYHMYSPHSHHLIRVV